ncbi:MAG: hypothetical protein WAM69_13130 [Candidatus Sulfotelmatobacter sp.]
MKRTMLFVAAAMLFAVPSALGQNTNMYFNGGYQGANWTYGSETVGTGFYDGSINGVQVGAGQSGGPGMICDDFNDNVYAGESWTASAINAASLTSSNLSQTLFGTAIGLQGYTELAYLVNQMFTTNPNSATQAAFSEAIWALTGGVSTSKLVGQALTFYNAAISMYTSGKISLTQFANLWIYTPNPRGPGEAQEMWSAVAVPEGGAALAYLLLAAFACCGAMVLRSRRQMCAIRGPA